MLGSQEEKGATFSLPGQFASAAQGWAGRSLGTVHMPWSALGSIRAVPAQCPGDGRAPTGVPCRRHPSGKVQGEGMALFR